MSEECYRIDEEDGEPRPIYIVGRMSQEALRETVRGLLDGTWYPSVAVPEELMQLVFVPLAMGALSPPDELREKLVGHPPKLLEDSDKPELPEEPEYPKKPGKPRLPKKVKVDPQVQSDWEWDEITQEEYDAHLEEVVLTNEDRAKRYKIRLDAYPTKLREWEEECERIRQEYDQACQAVQDELSRWADKAREAREAYDAWVEKHDRIFSKWGSEIGCLIAPMKNAFPRSINGHPMFHSFTIIHKDDWSRIHNACVRESERMENLEV